MVEAVEHAIASIDAGKRAVIHKPTGSGKTITLARLVQHYRRLGKRCLIIVHRKELIAQIVARLRDFGLDPAVEQGSRRAPKDSLKPVVASVLSLQGRRLKGWDVGAFAVVFTDECHHSEAQSYHRIYSHFSGMQAHVGFTATLDRYDKRSLLNTYLDGVLYSYSLLDAVLDGWLCRPKAVRIGIRPDLRECRLLAGDFVASELHAAIHSHLTDLAVATRGEVGSRRTIVFVPTVASAREFAQKLQILGLRAEAVWGTHPDRDALLTGFRAGDIQVVVNVALLNEGIDGLFRF
jgi:superfamily II DNA or RNA helicase